jgi:SAM-dependent methyltransferase
VRLARLRRFLDHRGVSTHSVLDVGCGVGVPGQEVLAPGGELHGFDLCPGAVEWARERAAAKKLDAEYAVGSAANAASYPSGRRFELVLGLGLLQHVTDDLTVLRLMRDALAEDGWMAVSLRNPLFALVTFNRPSYELFRELFAEFEAGPDAAVLDRLLRTRFDLSAPPQRHGPSTEPGFDDIVYRHHNPLTVSGLFGEAGLKVEAIDFYRHHALPPLLKPEAPETFRELSMEADERPNDWRSWFLCSTYLLYVRHLPGAAPRSA